MKGLLAALGEPAPLDDDPPIEQRQEPPDVIPPKKRPIKQGPSDPLYQTKKEEIKALPASMDAEKAVLCSILLDPSCLADLHLTVEHFHGAAHANIWKAIHQLKDERKPINLITVTQALADWKLLEAAGGPGALAAIQGFLPTAANVDYYASIVADKATLRGMISLSRKLGEAAQDSQWQSVEDLLAETQISLKTLAGKARDKTPEVKSVMEFAQADPATTLLGNRWLCRGGAALIIGSSGTGKSSSSMQQDLLWGAGMEAFGIRPAKPLKIITVQAENDSGDMHEMREGVMRGLELDKAAKELIEKNVLSCFEQSRTGVDFIENVVRPLLRKHRPDLIRIDPLAAYAGADITQASESAALLRNAINPLLTEFQCGLILVHHTPKTTSRDTTEWKPTDWMYSGAGSADIVNWARAVLVINPSYESGKFQFMAAKRGSRIGWVDEAGNREDSRWYKWADGGFHWVPCDAAAPPEKKQKRAEGSGQFEATTGGPSDVIEALKALGNSRKPTELAKHLYEQTGMKTRSFWNHWKAAKASPFISAVENGRFIHIDNLKK